MMNNILYKDLIVGWIDFKNRKILTKNDIWLIGIKRTDYIFNWHILMADIGIHTGCPCDRYCICKYFTYIDRIYAYENGIRSLPMIF